jgi:diguanylate cyclase (GGDEF)-like protein
VLLYPLPVRLHAAPPPAPSVAQVPAAPLELRTTQAIRTLAPELAERGLPVRLEAVVTFYNHDGGDLFLLDSTGGIYAEYGGPLELRVGSRVLITGATNKDYTNSVIKTKVTLIGAPQPVAATPIAIRDLVSGESDCAFISTTGVIQSGYLISEHSRQMMVLRLERDGVGVDVRVLDFSQIHIDSLLDAEVRVRGAAAGYFDDRKELSGVFVSAQTSDQIELIEKPPSSPYLLPLQPLNQILRNRVGLHIGQRTHVRGTVTYADSGHAVTIQNGPDPLFIRTRQVPMPALGSRIEAVGFAAFGNYSPILDNANFRAAGVGDAITPRALQSAAALDGTLDSKLISIDAELLSSTHDATKYTLSLSSGKTLFSALLDGPIVNSMQRVEPGSRVRITGICSVETDGLSKLIRGYRILMRSPADLAVISPPLFWKEQRLLYLVGGLLLTALLAFSWIIFLRKRVKEQTAEIRWALEQDAARSKEAAEIHEARSRVLEKINRREPLPAVLQAVTLLFDDRTPGASWCVHLVNEEGDLEAVPGACCPPLLREPDTEPGRVPDILAHAVAHRKPFQAEWPEHGRSVPITSANGEVFGAVTYFQEHGPIPPKMVDRLDLAAQLAMLAIDNRRLYDRLTHRSQHDELTGLPNRAMLDEELTRFMTAAVASGSRLAIAYVDLDHFKDVNDTYGHKAGDYYLQSIAARLRSALREGDTLARVGGDEFIAILSDIRDRAHAFEIVERLNHSLRKPLNAGEERELSGSASIGLALFPDDGRTLDELKHFADESMYQAKRAVRASETPAVAAETPALLSVDALREAIDRGRVVVHYQPIFSAAGKLTGFEALARIRPPNGALIHPYGFIETAEKSGLIVALGELVLRKACRQAAQWQRQTGAGLIMSVNVSARQLSGSQFAERIVDLSELAGLPPHLLRLELTESAVVENLAVATEHLSRLRSAGVRIAIDDFGTGYSNFSALQRLPFDIIKIDRSFVTALGSTSSGLPLLRAIVSIAKSLNVQTVVEGVELPVHVEVLARLGCTEFQGFGLAKPMPATAVNRSLDQWLAPVANLSMRLNHSAEIEGEPILELTA